MENRSKFRELLDSVTDFLNEQQWYQELKEKWEELDPQSRTYLKFSGVAAGILSILLIILTSIWSVHRLKSELTEKKALLSFLQTSNDELYKYKETTPSGGSKDKEGSNWTSHFENLSTSSGIDKSAVSVSPEKAGPSSDQSKEALYDISLKHVNIKQVVRYVSALEGSQRPIKVRNLQIDTKSDMSGYLDASIAVSGFTLVEQK